MIAASEAAGRGLLQAIIANPDDDTPRLIFADWLEEHDDLARAEFIRVQCELAALGLERCPHHAPDTRVDQLLAGCPVVFEGDRCDRCRWCLLRQRQRDLSDEHLGLRWMPEGWQGWGQANLYFRRGFIAHVDMPATGWLQHGEAILRQCPVERVRINEITSPQGTYSIWPPEGPDGVAIYRWITDGDRTGPTSGCRITFPTMAALEEALTAACFRVIAVKCGAVLLSEGPEHMSLSTLRQRLLEHWRRPAEVAS